MTEYTARATREGKWWVVDVDGVGHTQGRNLHEVQEMAADLVAVVRDVPVETVAINLVIDLPVKVGRDVEKAKTAIVDLTRVQHETADVSRRAVRDLVKGVGLTGRDASVILGVSPQRISQLLATPSDDTVVVSAARPAYAARATSSRKAAAKPRKTGSPQRKAAKPAAKGPRPAR